MEQQQIPDAVFGKPGFAMPMMRGFPCAVSVPIMGANSGPTNGLGIGWSRVEGHGIMFFVSIHAGDGMTLWAELDYARYKRLAELLASAGQQARLVDHADIAANDPLAALSVAHQALERARDLFNIESQNLRLPKTTRSSNMMPASEKDIRRADAKAAIGAQMNDAMQVVGAALGIVQPKEATDGEA